MSRSLFYLEHLRVFHEHLVAWDAHFIEAQIAVVVGVHAQFGSNLTHDNTRQRLVRLFAAKLDEEGVCSLTLALRVQLSHHHSVVGRLASSSRPPVG